MFPLALCGGVIAVEIWRGIPCTASVYPFLLPSCLLLSHLSLPSSSLYILVGRTMGNSNPQAATLSKIITG
jgi:hypothetical protein